MGSRDKDQTTSHHQPFLSSLVVRPSASDGADGGRGGGGGRDGGSDYEPGEVRREPPPYSHSDRYNDGPGYRICAGSSSPLHRRDAGHRHGSNFDRSGGPPRRLDFGNGRDPGRYRDSSPPYNHVPGGGRQHSSRGFDGTGYGPAPFRGESITRNNPIVRPREGDWICPDPLCGNLNFARREYCNKCQRFRATVGSPRGGYPGPQPSHAPPRRFPSSPVDLSPPGRNMNGFRSPLRAWAREGPRDFGAAGPPPPRHEGRFSDHSMRRDRLDYLDDDYRRSRFDRPMPMDWEHRDRGRDNFFNERKGYERRPPSPPPPPPPQLPPRGRWSHDVRERSRSPIRGAPPPKEYHRDIYLGRGREDRRGAGRDRMGDAY